MIIIKKSDAEEMERKGENLSCEWSRKYKAKKVKFNQENTSEQQRSKSIGTKKIWLSIPTKR